MPDFIAPSCLAAFTPDIRGPTAFHPVRSVRPLCHPTMSGLKRPRSFPGFSCGAGVRRSSRVSWRSRRSYSRQLPASVSSCLHVSVSPYPLVSVPSCLRGCIFRETRTKLIKNAAPTYSQSCGSSRFSTTFRGTQPPYLGDVPFEPHSNHSRASNPPLARTGVGDSLTCCTLVPACPGTRGVDVQQPAPPEAGATLSTLRAFIFPHHVPLALKRLTLTLTYGIIHPLKLGWERVGPLRCQRTRDSVSRDSVGGRKSSRSCKPKPECKHASWRVGETEPSFVIKDADMNVSGEAPEFSGSRVVPRELGSRLCHGTRAFTLLRSPTVC